MLTNSLEELPLILEKTNAQKENSSPASVCEKENVQEKGVLQAYLKSYFKMRYFQGYLGRYSQGYPMNIGYFSDYTNWKSLESLEPKFALQIHMVMAFSDDWGALIITKNKMVYGIGKNYWGRLGIGDTNDTWQPKKVEVLCGKNIKTLCCSGNISYGHVFALTEEGEVYSWGCNEENILQLGLEILEVYTPTKVISISEECIIIIACSEDHIIALTSNGKIYTWGNSHYNLSINDKKDLSWQVNHIEEKNITYVACGKMFNMAITNNGNVYSWGANDVGQLGIGNCTSQTHPCLITSLADVKIVKVVCGKCHTLALTAEGELYSWGKNTKGQLGNNKKTEKEINPIKLDILKKIKISDIAARSYLDISIAVDKNKYVYIWGECYNQKIIIPTVTDISNMYDLVRYNLLCIINNPLIDYTEEQSNILECLEEAFDDESKSDFTIQVEGDSIYVHKDILKIRSQYFTNLFLGNGEDSDKYVVVNSEFSYIVYWAFLKYLYTGMIDLPSKKALELLKLADAYGETNLKKDCIEVVKEIVTVSHVAFVYEKAIEYNSKELEDFCFQFALNHMTDVVKSENFAQLKESIRLDFIIKAAKAGVFKT